MQVLGATSAEVLAALYDIVSQPGQTLILFWGGHGVMVSRDPSRRLFFADTDERNWTNVKVESILALLDSTNARMYERQAVFIDTCANIFEHLMKPGNLGETNVSHDARAYRIPARFELYAAEPGRQVANDSTRRTGLFSEPLLDLLERSDEFLPNLDGLSRDMKSLLHGQVPVRVERSDWAGNRTVFGGLPPWVYWDGPPFPGSACPRCGLTDIVAVSAKYADEMRLSTIVLARDDTLTAREREVAGFIAGGLSNRDIAAAMVITEGTVEVHVKHILGKLKFRSRSQVAVWASEHGLTRAANNL